MNQFKTRVHLATVALLSFISALFVARVFTNSFPSVVLVTSGFHIHHFWFGIVLLAIGGWLGLNSRNKDVDIVAAIIYGVGGGLIVDEAGLLLTFGDYWSGSTWVIFVGLLAVISVLVLLTKYRQEIREELGEFLSSKLALILGIFLVALSAPFILQTDNLVVIATSLSVTLIGVIVIIIYFILQRQKTSPTKASHPALMFQLLFFLNVKRWLLGHLLGPNS